MPLPANHPQRTELNDEAHARTPEAIVAPVRVSYVALYPNRSTQPEDAAPIRDLARRFGFEGPAAGMNHFSKDFGPFRVKWERHTEFTRYTFIVSGGGDAGNPFKRTAADLLPQDWLQQLPGQVIVAAHAAVLKDTGGELEVEEVASRLFTSNMLIGSAIGGDLATALTDARIGPDNYSRILVLDRGMTPWQAGRMLQRLLEIETYRMMALLALPHARELGPFLSECEHELAKTMKSMAGSDGTDEQEQLDSLTRLEAAIETRHSTNQFRFSAAAAYYDLVQSRIRELREQRLPGLQTFKEFTERRLAPAMNTCRAVAARQDAISDRVSRGVQLLSTRVDVTRERQNQAVLESMNRRAHLQLRLQETVEGLSVAAVTYYTAGLVGYLAKGAKSAGYKIDPDIAVALSIPVIAVAVALGVRRLRKSITPMLRSWRFRP